MYKASASDLRGLFAPDNIVNALAYVVFAAIVLAFKMYLVNKFGSALPFWDQWDAEAYSLYKPYTEGTLSWGSLFEAHNEHRIFTTRILALSLLELNGEWNPILQMVVNAVLHTIAVGVLVHLIYLSLGKKYLFELLCFSAFLLSVPYAWENTISGFQSQFYFVLLFGTLCIWLLVAYKPFSKLWLFGLMFGALAYFSLASGIFSVAAAASVMFLQFLLGVRRDTKQILAIGLLAVFMAIAIANTPTVEGHAAFKAGSVRELLAALSVVFKWPMATFNLVGWMCFLPAAVFVLWQLLSRPIASEKIWFLFALVVWCVGQNMALAYGRHTSPDSSRYLDLLAIGVLVNFSVLLLIFKKSSSSWRRPALILLFVWVPLTLISLASQTAPARQQLASKLELSSIQEANVRKYLCYKQPSALSGLPHLHIPYPSADRLRHLLDDNTIYQLLPSQYKPESSSSSDAVESCAEGGQPAPYSLENWSGDPNDITGKVSAIKADQWKGHDYLRSQIGGLEIIGSIVNSDRNAGVLSIHAMKGFRLLYRTGPNAKRQYIVIDPGSAQSISVVAPPSSEWTILEFSGSDLPESFDVIFIDAGTEWGEWSAIGLLQ